MAIHVKRVVTAVDGGKSVAQEAGPAEPITAAILPGVEIFNVWGTEGAVPRFSERGVKPHNASFFPGPGGTRFGIFTFPPQPRNAPPAPEPDPEELAPLVAEIETKAPGLMGIFEPDNPGFHSTETVDYSVVLHGTMTLELDDGAEVELPPGTCIVQNGTRHAWRNYGDVQGVLAYVIVAADGD